VSTACSPTSARRRSCMAPSRALTRAAAHSFSLPSADQALSQSCGAAHWSTIALAREGRAGVTVEQTRAAEVLAALVKDRRILLPLSGGHLVETALLHASSTRVELATTVPQLGRGWRMRNSLPRSGPAISRLTSTRG
jgi:hypothetical protein